MITFAKLWGGTTEGGKSSGKKGCSSGFAYLPACKIPSHIINNTEVESTHAAQSKQLSVAWDSLLWFY